MKSIYILIITLCVSSISNAQNTVFDKETNSKIYHLVHDLDEALIEKDTAALRHILHKDLSMGHSNGWVETKSSLLKNLPTNKVKYERFIPYKPLKVTYVGENLKIIRRKLTAIGKYEREPFEVDLKILAVWKKENKNWLLLARQSVSVDF